MTREELYKYRLKRHPEWDGLTIEEMDEKVREIKRESIRKASRAFWDKYDKMSPEEKAAINKKKGNFYNLKTPEEKAEMNKALKQRSLNFWNGMDEKERDEFSKYRWNLKSDEEKAKIVNRFIDGAKRYHESLTKEDIDKQVAIMHKAYKERWENDPEFREEQIRLLRQHNKEYFDSLSPEEFKKHYSDMLAKADHIEHFRKQARNHVNILIPDKRFENQFNDSILNKDYYYEKEYKVRVDDIVKFWDYAIYDKDTNTLQMVVDLDGEFYHAVDMDYNGLHSKEERDEKRGYYIPENVKVHIINERNFINDFKSMMTELIQDYDTYIENLFQSYRSMEFPFPHYSNFTLIKSFQQLIRLDVSNKYLNLNIRNREGDILITHFHHSIYRSNTKGNVSPYDAWYDDNLLKKCIENRVLYRNSVDSNKIVQGFNVTKIAPRVSVFSAGRAKLIISKYLSEYDTIFDPFSGFSGRMLGTLSLNKSYIGQDISGIQISESTQMIDFLKMSHTNYSVDVNVILTCCDVLQSYGEYPCLFTCPPYSDKEQWLKVKPDKRSCDDWIDICISHFKCQKYVFVVDNTIKYKNYIVDEIINRSHFGSNSEYVILIENKERD